MFSILLTLNPLDCEDFVSGSRSTNCGLGQKCTHPTTSASTFVAAWPSLLGRIHVNHYR